MSNQGARQQPIHAPVNCGSATPQPHTPQVSGLTCLLRFGRTRFLLFFLDERLPHLLQRICIALVDFRITQIEFSIALTMAELITTRANHQIRGHDPRRMLRRRMMDQV